MTSQGSVTLGSGGGYLGGKRRIEHRWEVGGLDIPSLKGILRKQCMHIGYIQRLDFGCAVVIRDDFFTFAKEGCLRSVRRPDCWRNKWIGI